jgi:hypothetical protein
MERTRQLSHINYLNWRDHSSPWERQKCVFEVGKEGGNLSF